ncbi:hypothetical protein GUITHDRAFT_133941 [Guillardia theta CCMP2712]|uniref:C2 domain-containing protein n=1 Tax=Guillardia theta (strain CCMP2712) TaxID=905079 RepID=L1JVU8_GUITC|nr:hypothetical protein GUITHDRAFT_133941 [Guillardia theta CCMP2712]EKX52228.1 hypothetical protein GUITHDRAFT_133941 [Guillardia theta CCMP2712]|eukprot:XP_005839208.1 hypothetical protein GUITHDRAFT_133941 [Guillardia theta CCMP2712]
MEPLEILERRKSELLELHDLEGIRRQIETKIGQVKLLDSQQRVLDLLTSIGKEIVPSAIAAAIAQQKEQEQEVLAAAALTLVKLLRVTLVLHKNIHPEWEQKLEWRMTSQTKVLSVTLWDKDDVTSDNLPRWAAFCEEEELTLPLDNHKLLKKLRETCLLLRVHKLIETESMKVGRASH